MKEIKSVFETAAILKPDFAVDQLAMGAGFYEQLDREFDNFKDHILIAAHEFYEDWGMWERHPAGDEIVLLLSGRAELVLRTGEGDKPVLLDESGAYAVVPRGIWHTARVVEPTRMLFITPGEGTEHADNPPRP